MADARGNVDPLISYERHRVTLHFNGRDTRQHIEELVSFLVCMGYFAATRRNALLNDAELRKIEEPPAIADVTPGIVLSTRSIDWVHNIERTGLS